MLHEELRGGLAEALKSIAPDPVDDKPIDNNIRLEWNKYLDWLDKKGVKGHPELDKNDMGGKMIDAYRKENPSSPISREIIPSIQKEFGRYRDWSLGQVKNGKASLAEGVTPETYMKDLSIVDGIAGQRTTSFKFPPSYLTTFNNGQKVAVEDKGFQQQLINR
jgi:hypothetical protein